MEFTTRDVSKPTEGARVYLKRYWLCLDYDITNALFYGDSPQCNRNSKAFTAELITHVQSKIKNGVVSIVFSDIAFV